MTEAALINFIASAVPKELAANAQQLAQNVYTLSVSRVGRTPGAYFNKLECSFTLEGGTAKYGIGVDILQTVDAGTFVTFTELKLVQSPYQPIRVVSRKQFKEYVGTPVTGFPRWCTVYKDENNVLTAEFYPVPAGDYEVIGERQFHAEFEDIPFEYHDLIVADSVSILRGLSSNEMAQILKGEAMDSLRNDGHEMVSPERVYIERPLGRNLSPTSSRTRADSFNVNGE